MIAGLGRRPEIALVEISGVLGRQMRPAEYAMLFRRLGEDAHIRAVILEIDSPGGSATASDYLYLALRRLAAKKPVVAFIRGVGASGGYFLACAAQRIIAIPSAIIGSIGVISVRPVLVALLQRVGVDVSVSKSDPYKDMGAPYRTLTAEDLEKEDALVARFFDRFAQVVAEARRMTPEEVRRRATGEVYIGVQAAELGLIDETGDFERALELAAELGNVPRTLRPCGRSGPSFSASCRPWWPPWPSNSRMSWRSPVSSEDCSTTPP
ncbi:MAG: signal peptide peptidase SppA [Dehalococcoidia bacterium]|nr:signal peptide peptidase SppA [Dehalococcoidia bacterium]